MRKGKVYYFKKIDESNIGTKKPFFSDNRVVRFWFDPRHCVY